MTDELFQSTCQNAFAIFRRCVPNPKTRGMGYYMNPYGNMQKRSTGNMMHQSKLTFLQGANLHTAIISNKTPYIVYTNEKWISPQWKGHKNPNEGWFERATDEVAKYIVKDLSVQGIKATKRRVK